MNIGETISRMSSIILNLDKQEDILNTAGTQDAQGSSALSNKKDTIEKNEVRRLAKLTKEEECSISNTNVLDNSLSGILNDWVPGGECHNFR